MSSEVSARGRVTDTIYCHQCATANRPERQFCLSCQSPLHLRGNAGDVPRSCRQCGTNNPSFAKFCERCSTPLVPHPTKKPESAIPLVLNARATQGERCSVCGRST